MLKPKEVARRLNVTVRTLQNWDNDGILKAFRTPKDRRYYTEQQLSTFLGEKSKFKHRKTVLYARVSSSSQKDDLQSQIAFIQNYMNAKGVIADEVYTDVGSGMNYKRKKWNLLIDEVLKGEIDSIYIAYKDRFIRFGFEWFEQLCEKHGTKLIVLNNETLSPQQELVQDLVSIIHVFSSRIYGLRKYHAIVKSDKDLEK